MGTFRYRAKETSGNTIEGVVEAVTAQEAVDKINRLGYMPVRVEETASTKKEQPQPSTPSLSQAVPSLRRKVKSKEITAFGRQMSSLIRSGVPILRGISIVSEQSANSHFRSFLNQIHEDVKNGSTFSSALSRYPHLFPPLYIALVSAGETSGTLDQTLAKVTDYRQKQEEILSHIRSAMIYPAFMAIAGVGTIVFMLTFVMPRLMGVFGNLGGDLPLPTKILIQISTAFRQGWLWGAVATAALLIAVLFRGKKSGKKNLILNRLQLQVPVFGSLALKAEIARFSRTLELLIKSGIPAIQAIETATPVLSNAILKNELIRCAQDLKGGSSFGKSLKESKWFPIFMTNLLTIGEEAGKLDEALAEIAIFYERETAEAVRTMTSLIEPLMILAMGLVVGFIVIAMLLPMFELNMMVR
ncbi:MAG: type II secretion system F family protein [Candidatus Omnitrophica bacterium]|nr:type II secretion system F family protein [Candidatus Omnitrophota bacterium]